MAMTSPQGTASRPGGSSRAHLAQFDRHRLRGLVEQVPLRTDCVIAGDAARQGLGSGATFGIELAQLRDRLLHHLAAMAHRAHQLPVDVGLAVFASRAVAQVHVRRFSATHRASSVFGAFAGPQMRFGCSATRRFTRRQHWGVHATSRRPRQKRRELWKLG